MGKQLGSSADPPRGALVLLGGSMLLALYTAFWWLWPLAITFSLVGLGTAIYATSRFTKPRYRVVEEPAAPVRAKVVKPSRPAVKVAPRRPALVERTVPQLPPAPPRRDEVIKAEVISQGPPIRELPSGRPALRG